MCLLGIVGRPGVSWGVLGCPGVIRLTENPVSAFSPLLLSKQVVLQPDPKSCNCM